MVSQAYASAHGNLRLGARRRPPPRWAHQLFTSTSASGPISAQLLVGSAERGLHDQLEIVLLHLLALLDRRLTVQKHGQVRP